MKSKNKILAICAVLIVIAAVLLIVKPWAADKPAVTQPTVEPVVTESPTEAPTEEPTQEPTEVPTVAPAAADLTADNPVLAQVGDNQILLSDVQEIAGLLYNYGYTEKENDYQYALNYMLNQEIIKHHIAQAGLDQFTDEEKTAFANEAAAQWEEALNNYVEYYLTEDTQEQRDTLRAQAIDYYAAQGYSQDTLLENLMLEEEYNRLEEQLANGYTPTEDEINAVFNEYGEQYRQQYEGNVPMYEFYTQRYGYESWYVPEGYRAILHILLKVDDDLLTAYTDAENAYDEAEGAETPDEEAVAAAKTALDAAREAVLAYVQPQLDDIYARLEKGEDFKNLIVEYGKDPGMEDVTNLEKGYPVHKESIIYDSAFTQGAFQERMAKVGDYSDPVIGQNGVHVLYYLADMEGGLVMTDEIHQEISDYLVSNKVNEAYNAGLEAWKADMNIVTYQDALDAAQAQADAEAAEEEAAAQACVRIPYLPVKVRFRHQHKISPIIFLQRLPKRIKYLHRQLELQYLLSQRIIAAALMQFIHICADHSDHIVDYLIPSALVYHIVCQQRSQIEQRFQVIVDPILANKIREETF